MNRFFPTSRRPRVCPGRLTWSFRVAGIVAGLVLVAQPAPSPARAEDGGSGRLDGFPAAYAIKDARIVAAPGKVFDPGVVVVRRGVVEAVGASKDVNVPFDAEVINGK